MKIDKNIKKFSSQPNHESKYPEEMIEKLKNWWKIAKYPIFGLVVMFVKITGKKPSLEANICYEEKVLHDLIKNYKS